MYILSQIHLIAVVFSCSTAFEAHILLMCLVTTTYAVHILSTLIVSFFFAQDGSGKVAGGADLMMK